MDTPNKDDDTPAVPGTIKYRQHNGYDPKQASDEAALYDDPLPSMTIQAHAEDADINVIMRRYGLTGKLPDNPYVPDYGDFENITDFRSAMQAIRNAEENFATIPADIRARFANDPQRYLEFVSDENNWDEMHKLGLTKGPRPRPAEPAPTVPAVTQPAPSTPQGGPPST